MIRTIKVEVNYQRNERNLFVNYNSGIPVIYFILIKVTKIDSVKKWVHSKRNWKESSSLVCTVSQCMFYVLIVGQVL